MVAATAAVAVKRRRTERKREREGRFSITKEHVEETERQRDRQWLPFF